MRRSPCAGIEFPRPPLCWQKTKACWLNATMLFSPVTTMWKLKTMMLLKFSILVILGLNATTPLSSCVLRALGIPSLADLLSLLEKKFPVSQDTTLWAIWEIASTHHKADTSTTTQHMFQGNDATHDIARKSLFVLTCEQTRVSPSVQHCVRAHMQRCSGALPTRLTCKDAHQLKNLMLRASA